MTNTSPGLVQAHSRAAKLAALHDALDRAGAARSFAVSEAIAAKRAAINDLDFAIREHARHQTKFSDTERARYQARIDHATATVERLQNQDAGLTGAAGGAAQRCARWLGGLGDASPTIVDAKASTNLAADQDTLAKLNQAIEHLSMRAVAPIEETAAVLDKQLERMMAAGEPGVTAEGRVRLPHHVPSGQVQGVPDVASILMWLGGSAIRDHLHGKLDELYAGIDPGLVMSAKQKGEKMRALRAQHLDLQRKIAAAAWRLVDGGDDKAVLHLNGLEAPAILGVAV